MTMENQAVIRFTARGERYGGEEEGLAVLKELAGLVEEAELNELVHELDRLIHEKNLFGSDPNLRNQINKVIFSLLPVLKRLTGDDSVSFVDLCMGSRPELV